MAETAAAHLPERDAAGRDDRADRDRRLVPHAAGRVLVDDATAERAREVEALAARDHRVGERQRLVRVEAAEVDRHQERGDLVVGNLAARVAEHELGQLLVREPLAVPLALDHLRRADHRAFSATKIEVARRLRSGSSYGCGSTAASWWSEAMYACTVSSSVIVTQPSASRRSTFAK